MEFKTIEEGTAAAAEWLDEEASGWADRVEGEIDAFNAKACAMTAAFGSFTEGLNRLRADGTDDCRFDVGSLTPWAATESNPQWAVELKKRRSKVAA